MMGRNGFELSMAEIIDESGTKKSHEVNPMAGEPVDKPWQARLHEELQEYTRELEAIVSHRTAELMASEARFRTIFENSIQGIVLLDAAGKIVICNQIVQSMLGYSQDDLVGNIFLSFFNPDDAQNDQDLFQALVQGEKKHYRIQKRYLTRDGQEHWCELTVSRVDGSEQDRDRAWVAVIAMEDITEKLSAQQALLIADRLAIVNRLGASLTHEINNPMQSALGCLGLAEEMLEEESGARIYLQIAMEELERAADIVKQLRDLGRKPEKKIEEKTDLNALIEKTLLLTQKQCQNHDVCVDWQPLENLPLLPLIPDLLQEVFTNLVLNAVEAMSKGGRLKISLNLTSQPDGICIRFADNGIGIEPERMTHIFEPFNSTRLEGMGLGLYICKQNVEEQGGRIEVTSRVGKGSIFTVWIPR